MVAKKPKIPPLQEGLITAMLALDSQVARDLQRTPAQEEVSGVQKWGPYQKRIEDIATLLIDSVGDRTITLDPLIIITQAFSKALQILVSDLGQDGLGKIRSNYCTAAFETLGADVARALAVLKEERGDLN